MGRRLLPLLSLLGAACSASALPPLAPSSSSPLAFAAESSASRPTAPARLAPPWGAAGAGLRRVLGASNPATEPRVMRHPLVAAEQTRANVFLYHAFDRGTDPLSVASPRF